MKRTDASVPVRTCISTPLDTNLSTETYETCDWILPALPADEQAKLDAQARLSAEQAAGAHAHAQAVHKERARQEQLRKQWSANPFDCHTAPFGMMLETEGYAALRAMSRPVTASYLRLMPRTYAVACLLYDAVHDKTVWGQHMVLDGCVMWRTIVHGRWRKGRSGRKWPEKSLSLLNVLKSLTNPDVYAIANKDCAHSMHFRVHHVRFDIDMDTVFENHDLVALQNEIALCRVVFAAFGLCAHIMRTGNRGIQVIAPVPPLERRHASVLVACIRSVLKGTDRRMWQAKDFQSNLDGLMRLPLGRHAWNDSIAWMLDADGSVIPLPDQPKAVRDALGNDPSVNLPWVKSVGAWLASQGLSEPHNEMPPSMLTDLVQNCPRSALIKMLKAACKEFGAPLPSPQIRKTKNWLQPYEGETRAPRLHVGMGWARRVWESGFQAGEFWNWARADGQNGIGAAILFWGNRERAEAELVKLAQEVPCRDEANLQQRLAFIKWAVARNDIDPHYYKPLARHKTLVLEVSEEDTDFALRLTAVLVEKRQGSCLRRKAFRAKPLVTIQHILELVSAAIHGVEDGILHISTRTLAAEIKRLWPPDAVDHKEVARQMAWITQGPGCLLVVLEPAGEAKDAFSPVPLRINEGIKHLKQ